MATVKKNIFWSSLVSLIQVYTGSVVFIVLAKLMSIEDFGVLSFGFSLASIVLVFSDFGFSLMLMKDYPIIKQKNTYILNTLILKIIISSFSAVLFMSYLLFFYSDKWVIVGGVYVMFAIVTSFTVYLQALLKIQNKFNKYAETTIFYAVTVTLIIICHYLFKLDLAQIVFGFLIGKSLQLMWSLFLCKKNVFNEYLINRKLLKNLMDKSWSFAGHSILGILYFMVDTQLISYFLGAAEVALYQSIFRVLLIFIMISEIISNVLLPYLSYKFSKFEDVSYLVSNFFLFLLVLSCSMFLIFTTFKNEIVLILYSNEYLNALPIVLPLAIVLILRTTASVFGNVLTVSNNQKYRVITVFISLIVSVVLNFIFIPLYGIVISAWVSAFVHLILFSLYFYFSKKELPQINIVNKDTLQAISVTFLLYLIINIVFDNRFLGAFIGVILWIGYLYLFLIKKGNWNKLKLILDDKGI